MLDKRAERELSSAQLRDELVSSALSQLSSAQLRERESDDTVRGLRRADFADFIHFGKAPAEADRFNKTVYEVQRPYTWAAPSTPP